MTAIHAHLFLNHIPVVGLMFGLVFLIAGMKRSSVPTLLTGLRIFVMTGLIAIPVAISGLISERALQVAPWLDADAVRRHQLAGILTLVVLGGLAAYSGILLRASSRRGTASAWAKGSALVLAVAGLGMTLWTSDLGGAIRHTELSLFRAPSRAERGLPATLCAMTKHSRQFVFSCAH